MSLAGVIDRLDDWINPIVVKELRQAVKSRLVTVVLMLFLSLQLVIVGLFSAFENAGSGGEPLNARFGQELFMVLQAILLGTCMVLIPCYAGIRLSSERSDTNVDLLFISTLRPASIIAGKFFSALVLAMLVFSCCAPFMTFTYLLRGIDIPTVFCVLGIDVLAVILSTQFALFLASVAATRAFKVFLFLVALLFLCYIYAGMVAFSSFLLRDGVGGIRGSEFWAIAGVMTLGVLFCTGLLFCWSVALISPPSANRALLGRVFLVCTWLVLGGACLLLSWFLEKGGVPEAPWLTWMICSVGCFCLQFLISINERDSWGARVARTIPRGRLRRALVFLFYSGSAGGVLLSGLCIVLTGLLGWGWQETLSARRFFTGIELERFVGCLAGATLYTFCYGMSAVLLRAYLFPERVRAVYNWVLALLLVGLGCTLPWLLAFLFHPDPMSRRTGLAWWLLPNPFWSVVEIGQRDWWGTDYTLVCFLFLGAWSLIVFLGSILWVGEQIARFRPGPLPVKKPTATKEKEEEIPLVAPVEAE